MIPSGSTTSGRLIHFPCNVMKLLSKHPLLSTADVIKHGKAGTGNNTLNLRFKRAGTIPIKALIAMQSSSRRSSRSSTDHPTPSVPKINYLWNTFPNRSSPVKRAPPSFADPPPRAKLGSLDGNDIYEGEHLFWGNFCEGVFFPI
ncbi:hypothetical protein CEXT_206841 [Caerostris extrusa]|uniref:Uncharacterized protein n=1 Tax=Caerostris extrusa TaxID=172846 RepID=A0AAV4R4X8_CAEEX|nr:hypothetical protein CEXT_206841 [Caerostris extrusa]